MSSIMSSHHSRKSEIAQQLAAMDATLAYQEKSRHARRKKNGESLKGIRRFDAKKERMHSISSHWNERRNELDF